MKRKIITGILIGLVMLYGLHLGVVYLVNNQIALDRAISFTDVQVEQKDDDARIHLDETFKELDDIRPMEEIDPFDKDAQHWSAVFSLFATGVQVFDANGDGKLDVYLSANGKNWIRPTDENGVLQDEPIYQHNTLYLNQGNDGAGNPIYTQIKNLCKNDLYVEEELLVENYLYPRTKVSDSEKRPGRQSTVIAAADFNGDGRQDLLVAGVHPGMLWSHPKTQRVLPRFISPSGRAARHTKQPLAALGTHLIDYTVHHDLESTQMSSRGTESVAANTLYLNMGDKDNDGLPEWADVSREAGIEGKRSTASFSIADIDLDGDLDIFEGNVMDADFWPGGSKSWAGGVNQIYINQLAETGELKFIEQSKLMNVDGVYDDDNPEMQYYRIKKYPFLPSEYSLLLFNLEKYTPDRLTINGQEGEPGQISWASVFQDVNDDGYPDLWVANDFTDLELYINEGGTYFRKGKHPKSGHLGSWMSFAPADFNQDLKEDLFAGNSGGGFYSSGIVPDPFTMFDPVISDAAFFTRVINGYFDPRHILIDGSDHQQLLNHKVRHSAILPPDSSLSNNEVSFDLPTDFKTVYDRHSIDAYEFVWGSITLDIQNDGTEDLYSYGNLFTRGGGLVELFGTNPGRLLVNATKDKGKVRFVDQTAEHHLFNILELKYDRLKSDGYIYRKAPAQNWEKRDMVYSYDRSAWINHGREFREKIVNQDLIQTSENGRGAVAADLNQDGYLDIILRNVGGYDSRSSNAKNLQGKLTNGRTAVITSHDHNHPVLTDFDPGTTRVFMNRYTENNSININLVDDTPGALNRDAIGARVVINDRFLRVKRATQGWFIGNVLSDVSIGLGRDSAHKIQIDWPDKARTSTQLNLDELKNGRLTVFKSNKQSLWKSNDLQN
jgi:hypothetical protein